MVAAGADADADADAAAFGADTRALPLCFTAPEALTLPTTFTRALPPAWARSSEPSIVPFTIMTTPLSSASIAMGARMVQSVHVKWQFPFTVTAVPAESSAVTPFTAMLSLPPHSNGALPSHTKLEIAGLCPDSHQYTPPPPPARRTTMSTPMIQISVPTDRAAAW